MNVPFDGVRDSVRFDFDDSEAFAQLFRENFSFVRSVLRRYGVQPEQLDDLGQEVFITAYKRLHTLRSQAMLRSWLFGIARRHAANHRRKLAGMPDFAADPEASWLPERSGAQTTDTTSAELALVQAELRREIDKLSPKLRDTYVLSEIWGFSYLEVGEALEIAPKTATSRLRAARLHMAERARRMQAELDRSAGRSCVGTSLRTAVEQEEQGCRGSAWLLLLPALQTMTPPSTAGAPATPVSLAAPSTATSTLAGVAAVAAVVVAALFGVVQARSLDPNGPVAIEPVTEAKIAEVIAMELDETPPPVAPSQAPVQSPDTRPAVERVGTWRAPKRWQRPTPEPAEHAEGLQNANFPAVAIVRKQELQPNRSEGPVKMPDQARALLKRARELRDDGRHLEFQRSLDAFVLQYGTWRHDLRYVTERLRDLCRRGQIKSARSLVQNLELKSGQHSALLAAAAADCSGEL